MEIEEQEQHQIQKAYLKLFAENNYLCVYDKNSGLQKQPKTTNSRTTEVNFQSAEKEKFQNEVIENPGIRALRKLLLGKDELNERDKKSILSWVSLHSLRSAKRRKPLFPTKEEYESRFDDTLKIEQYFFNKMVTLEIKVCSGDDYFITSDNPVKEVEIEGKYYALIPLSPKEVMVLTNQEEKYPTHNEISFPEMANAMQVGGCYQECYSNRKDLPFDALKIICIKYNLIPELENMPFKR